jgi:hypothetical protein
MSLHINPHKAIMIKPFTILLTALFIFCGCSSTDRQYSYVNTSTNKPFRPPIQARQIKINPSYPVYYVKKGDTLFSISRRSKLSVFNIKRFNQLKSEHLEVGQKVFLPGVYKLSADSSANKIRYATSPTIFRPSTPGKAVPIVSRSKWSKYKIKGNIKAMGKVNKITVHHTDDGPALSKMTDVQFLRAIENHHRNTRKWACIGYHYIIGRNGTVYEGRPAKYQGAHARSNNPNNIGISLVGDFDKAMPAKSQISSLESLLTLLRKKHKVSSSKVYGHGHLGQTHCPGKHLKNWLEIYRSRR